ncbi:MULTISPECIES: hypothetical protein [unclassified Pseudomonas]|nr:MULTISPECIES: hypothetical protein [unclassified Pseudomonas]
MAAVTTPVASPHSGPSRQLLLCARDFLGLPGYAAGLVDRLTKV